MSGDKKLSENVSLINGIESLYSSWYRNLIITIGAGLLLYIQFIKNENLINKKFKIIIFMFILTGIITGIYYTREYYKKIEYIKKNNLQGILDIQLNSFNKTMIASLLITLYIITFFYIIDYIKNK